MWINKNGLVYAGDCAAGDRKATDDEISAWDAARVQPKAMAIGEVEMRLSVLSKELDVLAAQVATLKA